MSEHDLDELLEGTSKEGFTPPTNVADPKAAWEAHTRTQSAPVEEPATEPVARTTAPEPQIPDPADIQALKRAGWSAADLKSLDSEAAARHALRESVRSEAPGKTERTDETSGPDDLETLLTEEFSSKTAKKLAPFLRSLKEDQAALSRNVRENSLAGIRDRYVGTYPELARPEVERAVLSIAGPVPSPEQYDRALRVLYGKRQAPDERNEARAQVGSQMTSGRRGPAPVRGGESADRAAWAEYQKTGDVNRALSVKQRLGG